MYEFSTQITGHSYAVHHAKPNSKSTTRPTTVICNKVKKSKEDRKKEELRRIEKTEITNTSSCTNIGMEMSEGRRKGKLKHKKSKLQLTAYIRIREYIRIYVHRVWKSKNV